MQKYQWAIEDLYKDASAFHLEAENISKQLDFSEYCGKLGDKSTFKACMEKLKQVSRVIEKLSVYAMMQRDIDTSSSEFDALMSKVMNISTQLSANLSFLTPELTALNESVLKDYINDEALSDYSYMLKDVLKNKAHVLSEAEEKLLALSSEPLSCFKDIFTKIDNADLPLAEIKHNGEKIQLSHGTYGVIMHGKDRALRKKTFKAYYKGYADLLNTISSTYIGSVKKDVFYAKAKKYPSALERAFSSEDVSPVVYENLIKSVRKALPTLHQYIREKKRLLGYSKMHCYDLYVPVTEAGEIQLPYDKAYDLVKEGLQILGEEYVDILERARSERWISVYETKNKRSGAYSVCVYDCHPFVLLNYKETTHDVFTIAHEMGHSIHSYYSNMAQPYEKADYKIFVAEVASTVNEVLLLRHLLKQAKDDKLKKYLLSYLLEMIRTTLFRQTMFSEFEEYSHKTVESGNALTKDGMNEKYLSLNKLYYGKSLESDEEIAYEWARIPHFYSAFYVYKYATGIISAIAIAERILQGEENAVEDYFNFLSSGSKDKPVELLKLAGVDLNDIETYKKAFNSFESALIEFENL